MSDPPADDDDPNSGSTIKSWREAMLKTSSGNEILVVYALRVIIGIAIFAGIVYFVLRGR